MQVRREIHHAVRSRKSVITQFIMLETAYKPMVIEKSESVMLRLKEIADIGFSPWLTSISGTHSVLSKRY
jgi:hypothetical protein